MNLTDELERLNQLHKDGTLSDDEFTRAKRKLLSQPEESKPVEAPAPARQESSDRDYSFPLVMIVVAVVLLLIVLFAVVPHLHRMHWYH